MEKSKLLTKFLYVLQLICVIPFCFRKKIQRSFSKPVRYLSGYRNLPANLRNWLHSLGHHDGKRELLFPHVVLWLLYKHDTPTPVNVTPKPFAPEAASVAQLVECAAQKQHPVFPPQYFIKQGRYGERIQVTETRTYGPSIYIMYVLVSSPPDMIKYSD